MCSYLQEGKEFKLKGCPNCPFLEMKGSSESVTDCTSGQYDGIVALTQPKGSWVGKWQRVNTCEKGLYAVRVTGRLADNIVDNLQAHGIPYRPRDEIEE